MKSPIFLIYFLTFQIKKILFFYFLDTLQTRLTLYLRLESSKTCEQNVSGTFNNKTNIQDMKAHEEFTKIFVQMNHAYDEAEDIFHGSHYDDPDHNFGYYMSNSDMVGHGPKTIVCTPYSDDDFDDEDDDCFGLDEDFESYHKKMNLINSNGVSGYPTQQLEPVLIDISLEDDDVIIAPSVPIDFDQTYRSFFGRSNTTVHSFKPSNFLTQSPLESPKPLRPDDSLMSYMQLIIKKVSIHLEHYPFSIWTKYRF